MIDHPNPHLELGAQESAMACNVSDWERFVTRCEKLCARHLHQDHIGRPTFDGSDEIDGYSLDWLQDQFRAGKRPLDVLHNLLWRKHDLHK